MTPWERFKEELETLLRAVERLDDKALEKLADRVRDRLRDVEPPDFSSEED